MEMVQADRIPTAETLGHNENRMPPKEPNLLAQGHGFVIGASFGLQVLSLRCRVLVCNAVDTASLATLFLFGKLLCVATLFAFGEKAVS